ncbi:MAG: FAD-binding protein [Adlercreutzia equolifaciens]
MGEIKGMGRRDFLKTAALSGLALGGAAALTGCAPSTGAEKGASAKASAGADVAWDKEVDVLVIGSGTGAFAALVAAAKGAESVCLVEKEMGAALPLPRAALAVPLTYAATDAGITDSKEEVVKYFTNATDGRVDQAVLNSFIDNGSTFIDWISEEMGWKFAARRCSAITTSPWMAGFPWVAAARRRRRQRFARLLRCGSDVPTTCSTRRCLL